MLLEKAHCIGTRFFGADQKIPVRIGGAVEFDDNGQRGLGWVLGWDFNQEIKIRKVFDSEILAREDCQRSKRIAAYMKPYEVLDTTVETVVRREQIIARKYVLTPDVWTKTMQLSKVHYKVVAVLGVKHTASTDQSDGEIPVIERTFHNLDCGTLQEV
jgi:hypothetical protein